MFKLGMYSVFDSKAEQFTPPFSAGNDALAVRVFSGACSEPTHDFHRHAEDFTLFKVGEFDQEKGVIVPCSPESIVTAIVVVSQIANQMDLGQVAANVQKESL